MTDSQKRRELNNKKEYLKMDKYISDAVHRAENNTTFGSKKNYVYSVDSSKEFKQKMNACINYYNKIEDDSLSQNFVSKFIQVEKKLKEAYKGDIYTNNAKELRNKMSEIEESWRMAFGHQKTTREHLSDEYSDYPYHPKIIHITLLLLSDENEQPSFPNTRAMQIIQDIENMLNSENKSSKIEVNNNIDIAEEEDVNEGRDITKSEFLGTLEHLKRAKQSASYESLKGSNTRSHDILISLIANYLTEEKGLDKNKLPPEMNINDFRNVFCKQTTNPEIFKESVDQIIIGLQKVGMIDRNVNSIGQISKRNVNYNGEYGENIARVLENLSNYAQEAYDTAGNLVEEDDKNDDLTW